MPLDPAELEPLLRLAVVPRVGAGRIAALLARFGTAERALRASTAEVAALPGFGREMARRVADAGTAAGLERACEALARMRRVGAVAITPADDAFPDAFRHLADPPFLLFAAGRLELLRSPGVGVVGTRAPTPYGRQAAATLSRDLVRAGFSIVSGMAKGIDAAAHAAALQAGGGTVGVLGQGIDRVYPPENARLFGAMRERGLLLTELAPGEDPNAGNFPRRNRLIAALSDGVLVVEMGERSGARHTVDYTLELGREVFAVPGPIGSAASAGTNQLLKDGARLVTSARDIVEELRGVGHPEPEPPPPLPSLPEPEAAVYARLGAEPRHVDDLAAAATLPSPAVLTALLGLEIRELAEALPGKHYRRR
jgi:DNA processing protein